MNTLLEVIVDNDILSQTVWKGESSILLTGVEKSSPTSSLLSIYNVLDSLLRGGNGTPLQYSCLENPMDGGAW